MNPPEELRAVIFDLDGTLVDTAEEFVVAVRQLRAEHHLPDLPDWRVRSTVSNGARALVTLALTLTEGDPGFETQRLRLLELYSAELGTVARPYPGIVELITQLAKHNIPWAIATNKPRAYTNPLLHALNFSPAPASVVCPDDVSQTKPDPECLLLSCERLNCLPGQAIYIGDHNRDIEAGRRAGIYTIAAAYGYIEPNDNAHQWGADALVKDSAQLVDILLSRSVTNTTT